MYYNLSQNVEIPRFILLQNVFTNFFSTKYSSLPQKHNILLQNAIIYHNVFQFITECSIPYNFILPQKVVFYYTIS